MGPKIINLLPHRVVLPAVFRVVYIMVHSQARHEDGTATISCKEIHKKLLSPYLNERHNEYARANLMYTVLFLK